jgi:hypothetical protein
MQVHNRVKFVLPDLDTKRHYTLFIIKYETFYPIPFDATP